MATSLWLMEICYLYVQPSFSWWVFTEAAGFFWNSQVLRVCRCTPRGSGLFNVSMLLAQRSFLLFLSVGLGFCCLFRFSAQVWRGQWYMGCFGGPSPKRHVGWSSDEGFMRQLMERGGFLSASDRDQLAARLAKRGTSKGGAGTFTGCKKLLKQSQNLVVSSPCCLLLLLFG